MSGNVKYVEVAFTGLMSRCSVAWCYWKSKARAIVDENGPVCFFTAKGSYPAIWMP